MNLYMDTLGDPLTTCPIQTGWEFPMKPYPSGQFGFIDDPERQLGNSSVLTRTQTRSDGPEPLLTIIGSILGPLFDPPQSPAALLSGCTIWCSSAELL